MSFSTLFFLFFVAPADIDFKGQEVLNFGFKDDFEKLKSVVNQLCHQVEFLNEDVTSADELLKVLISKSISPNSQISTSIKIIKIMKPFTLDDLRNKPCFILNPHLDIISTKKKSRAKFNNSKVEYEGMVFDSKKEYRRYRELLLLQKKGIIMQLKTQVPFLLIEKQEGERKLQYIADFTYYLDDTGEFIIEDCKSEITRKQSTYINKRKMMLKIHKIKIKET